MIEFKTRDQRDAVEDHLFWMYRVTYEIEMHINTVLYLDSLICERDLRGDLTTDMIFYHNELALIRTAFILKNKPNVDEKHSLFGLQNFLNGKQVKTSNKSIKIICGKISTFYGKHQMDIDKLIKKRDAEAHELKVDKQIELSNSNQINFNKILEIIQEARAIINELYILLFKRDLSPELKYPIDLYNKIYNHSIEIIASELQSQDAN
ncbi:hypothetical protein [Sphingobacterium faecium]|uniref:hypothetical protein n=1 Tax=Sphingobacterium faecium TaxID=34087 RepID=UPI002468B853|nr:hypothetical protein [Sphingobacterium faecium]MDH5827322.1 hypothetical protein [Sphingobacterium faecium]